MGYTIKIGELKVEKNEDGGLDYSCISFCAEDVHSLLAPAFGEPTDNTNSRWPSYSSWSDALKFTGLYDLFYDDYGHLIGGHPGVRLVTKGLAEEVAKCKLAFEEKYPNVEATYGEPISLLEGNLKNPVENGMYCRLVWIDYWIKWALANCKTPVIVNS